MTSNEEMTSETHLALLHRQMWRNICEGRDARVLESRIPELRERCTLRVGEDERQDLVGVRVEEGLDGLEVVLDSTAVKQGLGSVKTKILETDLYDLHS